jgi:hypothetical protein
MYPWCQVPTHAIFELFLGTCGPMTGPGPKSQAPKVRIRKDLYDRVDTLADAGRKQGATRTGIIEAAIETYLSEANRPQPTLHAVQPEDPAIAPQSDYERRILAATLLFLREEKDSGQLVDLLETLLKDQLARVSNDGRNKPTKKRA